MLPLSLFMLLLFISRWAIPCIVSVLLGFKGIQVTKFQSLKDARQHTDNAHFHFSK